MLSSEIDIEIHIKSMCSNTLLLKNKIKMSRPAKLKLLLILLPNKTLLQIKNISVRKQETNAHLAHTKLYIQLTNKLHPT